MISLPDLEIIVTGNQVGVVKFWKYDEFTIEHIIEEPVVKERVNSLCYLGDKRHLFAGGSDSTLSLIYLEGINNIDKWHVFDYTYSEICIDLDMKSCIGEIIKICSALDYQHIFYNIGSKIVCFNNYTKKITNISQQQEHDILSMVYLEKQKLLIYSTNNSIQYINPYNSTTYYSISTGSFNLRNLISCTGKQGIQLIRL